MNVGTAPLIHYDPKLVEEAVFHAQRDSYVARELDENRSRIYAITDAEQREPLFQELYGEWFARLGLGESVTRALREQPLLLASVQDCYVVCAVGAKEEGAELFVAADPAAAETPRRTLRILIRPQSLLDRATVLAFLRHELFHIADMVDPAFGYEPALPRSQGGDTYDTLITNRYRVLWDATINGRMMRRGWLPPYVRDQELQKFRQAFPMLKESAGECFQKFFDDDHPSHAALALFAFDPRAAAGEAQRPGAAGTHCALCRFPTHVFEPEPENLGDEVLAAITRDFPGWTPAFGLCMQCADLYRASRISLEAAKILPGGNQGQEGFVRGGHSPNSFT
jgi:hypothetical protein